MDQTAIIPTTTAMVNRERCIYILLVMCRLRIEPTHSTWQAGGNLGRSQGSSPGSDQWLVEENYCRLAKWRFGGADECVRPHTISTESACRRFRLARLLERLLRLLLRDRLVPVAVIGLPARCARTRGSSLNPCG